MGDGRPTGPVGIDVVVAARDAAPTIGELAAGLRAQEGIEAHVVVVDDGSVDGTASAAARALAGLPATIVRTPPSGIAAARNTGAAVGSAPLVAFCDADDRPAPGWLAALAAALAAHDLVGGAARTELLSSPAARRWRPPLAEGLQRGLGGRPYALSANLGVRRDALEALGGFDERFRRGGTDVELSWRALDAGLRVGAAPDAVVHHRLRATRGGALRQAWTWGRADRRLAVRFGLGRCHGPGAVARGRRRLAGALRPPSAGAMGTLAAHGTGYLWELVVADAARWR